jgi:hypothetical protein
MHIYLYYMHIKYYFTYPENQSKRQTDTESKTIEDC